MYIFTYTIILSRCIGRLYSIEIFYLHYTYEMQSRLAYKSQVICYHPYSYLQHFVIFVNYASIYITRTDVRQCFSIREVPTQNGTNSKMNGFCFSLFAVIPSTKTNVFLTLYRQIQTFSTAQQNCSVTFIKSTDKLNVLFTVSTYLLFI